MLRTLLKGFHLPVSHFPYPQLKEGPREEILDLKKKDLFLEFQVRYLSGRKKKKKLFSVKVHSVCNLRLRLYSLCGNHSPVFCLADSNHRHCEQMGVTVVFNKTLFIHTEIRMSYNIHTLKIFLFFPPNIQQCEILSPLCTIGKQAEGWVWPTGHSRSVCLCSRG